MEPNKTGIPAEAGDRLAEALLPLRGHAPGHSDEDAALRLKSAADTHVPARTRPPAVTTADFQSAAATGGYPFGLPLAAVAAGLRKLADATERGDVNPQRVTVLQEADHDNFHQTTLTFVYNDKQGAV